MAVTIICDRCKREFFGLDANVNVFRFYGTTKHQALLMEWEKPPAYDCDYHICSECSEKVFDVLEGGDLDG